MRDLPLKHLSIRVPWHDNGWTGSVCRDPKANASCLVLREIRLTKNDEREQDVAGRTIDALPPERWPACIGERATFMAPFDFTRRIPHPYASFSEDYEHILPAHFWHPAYSAAAIPFRWMMRENAWKLAEEHGLGVDPAREPMHGWLERTAWVQDHENQEELLETFFSAVKPADSLCFFYAKHVPLTDTDDRVLIGAGRVVDIGVLVDYEYAGPGRRSYVWDRYVQHSIRPSFEDGFLLPYAELLQLADRDESIEPADFVATAPDDRRIEFSYATEHVTNDGAIAALLTCKQALEKSKGLVRAPAEPALAWIDARLGELWKARGPYPGLGAALSAFGIPHGHFLAYELEKQRDENEDPWPHVDKVMADPSRLPPTVAATLSGSLREQWQLITEKRTERRDLLQLIARFEVTAELAARFYVAEERDAAGIECSDRDLLENPYLIYEHDRQSPIPISIWTIDRGVFPVPLIREAHPLPVPSAIDGATDARRVRAMTIHCLEAAAEAGHTLQPRSDIVLAIRSLAAEPDCPVNRDLMDVAAKHFAPAITEAEMADESPAYQLERLDRCRALIRGSVERRMRGKRHTTDVDWRSRLDLHLSDPPPGDEEEERRARTEKAAGLSELADSRLSVLIGPAGTGKTTLLSLLCREPAIDGGGVLLLAPTGKARVRLGPNAQTLAQFLLRYGRFDEQTATYRMSDREKYEGAKTVIVDEASMLTDEQLGALLDALKGVERLILAGDPRQLPPIGPGRPFVDIIRRLAPENVTGLFPRVAPGYVELTIPRRHPGQEREDLQLAAWFSGQELPPGDDEILSKVVGADKIGHLRFEQWDTTDELRDKLLEVLVEELPLAGSDDIDGFERTLGGTDWEGRIYFHRGAAAAAERWQILSPVRGLRHGVRDLNKFIQTSFRRNRIEDARDSWRFLDPVGPEGIVYGDKVINVKNRRRKDVWPKDGALAYVANGEIGIVIGQFKSNQATFDRPWKLEIEFSSQQGHKYGFRKSELGEEAAPLLELAYAITVHKSQGSEFDLAILVLPNQCRLLSRELLYTALTRQRERIVVLHQGPRSDLRRYASDEHSETARRLTNLFSRPKVVLVNERPLEEGLIHRSGRGEPMRSKSEVIVANSLAGAGIEYVYEAELRGLDGGVRLPDFTIEDAESGTTFYWEHCGLMGDEQYRRRWERKLVWYRGQDILPWDEGGGARGTLIITEDDPVGGIDAQKIKALIREIWP